MAITARNASAAAANWMSATGLDTPRAGMRRQRIGGALKAQDGAGVLVDEQRLVGQVGEAFAQAGDGEVAGDQMGGGEARRHADRGADMQRERGGFEERRTLLARGVGEFMAAQSGQIHADIAEHAERALEPVAGIALLPQGDDMHPAFVVQCAFQRLADAGDIRPVGLRGIERFKRAVQRDEPAADPAVEGPGMAGHLWLSWRMVRAVSVRPGLPAGLLRRQDGTGVAGAQPSLQ